MHILIQIHSYNLIVNFQSTLLAYIRVCIRRVPFYIICHAFCCYKCRGFNGDGLLYGHLSLFTPSRLAPANADNGQTIFIALGFASYSSYIPLVRSIAFASVGDFRP